MNIKDTLELYSGGPGSGCHGPNCGRPDGGTGSGSSSPFSDKARRNVLRWLEREKNILLNHQSKYDARPEYLDEVSKILDTFMQSLRS